MVYNGVVALLLGTSTPKIDDKWRLVLPAKFRDAFENGLVITPGEEKCLYLLPQKQFYKMYERILHSEMKGKTAYLRLFTAGAHSDDPDRQGRITIPAKLREYANIVHDVAVVGVGKRVELWNLEAWHAYEAKNVDNYAQISEEMF